MADFERLPRFAPPTTGSAGRLPVLARRRPLDSGENRPMRSSESFVFKQRSMHKRPSGDASVPQVKRKGPPAVRRLKFCVASKILMHCP